jgi:predicted transcriptional regulator
MGEVQTRNGLYGFEFRDVDLRRSPDGERKSYEIKQLWQRNHEILNLVAQGFDHNEVAEIMGVTPVCVSQTVNSELGQKKLSELRKGRDEEAKKTVEKIRVLTNKAIQVYHEIFDNEDGQATLKDRKDVADKVLLELSGLRTPTKIQSTSVTANLTTEELTEFRTRGTEALKNARLVIDITSESKDESDRSTNTDKGKD